MSDLDDKVKERAAARSLAKFGFSMEGGRGTMTGRVDADDVNAAIKLLVGDVVAAKDDEPPRNDLTGMLHRSLPASFPRFPELFCERIEDGQGVVWAGEEASPSLGLGNNWQNFGRYKYVEMAASFLPRPYDLLTDDEITATTLDWLDADGTVVRSKVTTEYLRWTDWDVVDGTQLLTADQGAMYIAASDNPLTPQDPPHGCEFPGKPSMPVHEDILTCTWFQVPVRYWTSPFSNLRRWKYRVNLNPVVFGGASYLPGQLLYMGTKVRRYCKPYPKVTAAGDVVRVRQAKLADFTLAFALRQTVLAGHPPDRDNFLFSSPHNGAPTFLDPNKWYSVIMTAPSPNENDVSKWRPTFASFPAEILFTDPDA